MPKVTFAKPFKFSPDGFTVVRYAPSSEGVEVSERCAEVARAAGVLAQPKAPASKSQAKT